MRLLLLGGTVFLGRHITAAALAAGHDVTLFHRGLHGPDLFPEAQHLCGDRDGGLDALAGRLFDAVIDTSGYVPRVVKQSAELLAPLARHYTFISSISAYRSMRDPGTAEDAPLAELPDAELEDMAYYGALKASCESVVSRAFPDRCLLVRPGLIVGPDDPTDRFTYWVERLARPGEVLAPGGPKLPAQVIDVRDLAAWTLAMAERGATGAYNATGPEVPLTLGEVLETCRSVGGHENPITWVPEEFLTEHGVAAWSDMPLFVGSDPEVRGMLSASIDKALGAGLALRPLLRTVADTLAWERSRPLDHPWRAGITAEREEDLLRTWHRQAD